MLSTVNAPNSNLRAFRKQDVKLKLSKIKNINILFVKFLTCGLQFSGIYRMVNQNIYRRLDRNIRKKIDILSFSFHSAQCAEMRINVRSIKLAEHHFSYIPSGNLHLRGRHLHVWIR